jgi:peptide/nickel transport system substrate-binding protein
VHVRSHRRLTLLPLVLAGGLLLGGCSEWGPGTPPKSGGTLTVTVPSLPSTWDPDAETGAPSGQPIRDVEAPLLQTTPHTHQVAPGLARTVSYDSSRTHLTVTLRPKAEFSNGHVVTSKDVVFSVEQWLAGPQHGSFYSGLISGVKAKGKRKVVISLPQPSSALTDALTLTSSAIVPDHFGGRSAASFYAHPIGAGPFAISSTSAHAIVLKPNKHFYDVTHPFLGHLDYRPVSDPATALERVGSKKADLALGVPASALAGGHHHARVVTSPSLLSSVLTFSAKSPAAADPKLRKAVSLAIDRSALVTSVYDGKAQVAQGLLPSGKEGSSGCLSCDWSQHDAGTARKDAASSPGHRQLTLLVDSTDPTDVRTAQAITPMLAEAGLTVQTLPVDPATMVQRLAAGDYDLALQTLAAQTSSMVEPLLTLGSGHYLVGTGAAATAASALRDVGAASAKADQAAAVAMFEQHVFDTTAAVPLVDPEVIDVVGSHVRGLDVSPSGFYHSSGLWLKN